MLVQAAAFGLLHLKSASRSGAVGVGLAAIYAVMLGVLRRRAGGLLAPHAAHVAADLTIFAPLLTWTSRGHGDRAPGRLEVFIT